MSERKIIGAGDVQGILSSPSALFTLKISPDDYVHITKDDIMNMLDILDLVIQYSPPGGGVPRVVKKWEVSHIVEPHCTECETADI